ncbi:hypothetical protein Q8A67_018907 [Cirrhinus molitorella]|uniref:Uncharacterized protein n=1 Tax=Cirrhinus molitorella TaxID=172907 RepID=A0AA88TJF6_9TELE|nr:hypothetical protein Q8A67_018907 [Cirrhinus molitorella]
MGQARQANAWGPHLKGAPDGRPFKPKGTYIARSDISPSPLLRYTGYAFAASAALFKQTDVLSCLCSLWAPPSVLRLPVNHRAFRESLSKLLDFSQDTETNNLNPHSY